MIKDLLSIIVEIIIIICIVYFIYKTWEGRKLGKEKATTMFILSIVIAFVVLPMTFNFLGHSLNSLVHPVPTLTVSNKNNYVQITGTNTEGTLKGRTRPNTLVKLKESDDIDNVKRSTKSDRNGNFKFTSLEPDSKFKLSAVNGPNSTKAKTITISDIPDSAYTKLKINHSDWNGDIKVKTDTNNNAKISGTSSKNATIKLLNNSNYDTIKKIKTKNGKWTMTLSGQESAKKVKYELEASSKKLLDSSDAEITVINPNYKKPEPKKETTNNTDKSTNSDSDASDKTTDDTTKSSQKEDQESFVADMNAYLQNQYPDVTFSYSGGNANFIVPNEVAGLNKQEMKAYVDPLYSKMLLFSGNEDMKDVPTILVKTQDGTPIARTSLLHLSGYKVYAKK